MDLSEYFTHPHLCGFRHRLVTFEMTGDEVKAILEDALNFFLDRYVVAFASFLTMQYLSHALFLSLVRNLEAAEDRIPLRLVFAAILTTRPTLEAALPTWKSMSVWKENGDPSKVVRPTQWLRTRLLRPVRMDITPTPMTILLPPISTSVSSVVNPSSTTWNGRWTILLSKSFRPKACGE